MKPVDSSYRCRRCLPQIDFAVAETLSLSAFEPKTLMFIFTTRSRSKHSSTSVTTLDAKHLQWLACYNAILLATCAVQLTNGLMKRGIRQTLLLDSHACTVTVLAEREKGCRFRCIQTRRQLRVV
jgi:hypothetical protein